MILTMKKTNMRGWKQASTMNLEVNGARYGGQILLRSPNAEKDNEKPPLRIVEALPNKEWKS